MSEMKRYVETQRDKKFDSRKFSLIYKNGAYIIYRRVEGRTIRLGSRTDYNEAVKLINKLS